MNSQAKTALWRHCKWLSRRSNHWDHHYFPFIQKWHVLQILRQLHGKEFPPCHVIRCFVGKVGHAQRIEGGSIRCCVRTRQGGNIFIPEIEWLWLFWRINFILPNLLVCSWQGYWAQSLARLLPSGLLEVCCTDILVPLQTFLNTPA